MSLYRLSSRIGRTLFNCCRISLFRSVAAAILLSDSEPFTFLSVVVAVVGAVSFLKRRPRAARNVLDSLEVRPIKAYLRNSGHVGRTALRVVSGEAAAVGSKAGNMPRGRDWRPQCVRRCADRMKFWNWCKKKEEKRGGDEKNGGPVRSSIEDDPDARAGEELETSEEETVGCCGFRRKKDPNQRCC